MVEIWRTRREGTFVRNKLGRKGGRWDETTLIGVYAQVAVYTTQFLLLMQSGSSQASLEEAFFFFFGWWDKASASRERHWPPYRCTALFGTSTVSEHSILRELVFPSQTAMYWICGITTGSCITLSSTIGKLNNSISQTTDWLIDNGCDRDFQLGHPIGGPRTPSRPGAKLGLLDWWLTRLRCTSLSWPLLGWRTLPLQHLQPSLVREIVAVLPTKRTNKEDKWCTPREQETPWGLPRPLHGKTPTP